MITLVVDWKIELIHVSVSFLQLDHLVLFINIHWTLPPITFNNSEIIKEEYIFLNLSF